MQSNKLKMENRCLLIVKSMNENIAIPRNCKNKIIRKQKHFNGKTKHKTIDRNLQKPTTYILQK